MAHHTEQVGFPAIPLNGLMSVRLRALSPTTDAEVAGVTCTLWALYGRDESDSGTVERFIPALTAEQLNGG